MAPIMLSAVPAAAAAAAYTLGWEGVGWSAAISRAALFGKRQGALPAPDGRLYIDQNKSNMRCVCDRLHAHASAYRISRLSRGPGCGSR